MQNQTSDQSDLFKFIQIQVCAKHSAFRIKSRSAQIWKSWLHAHSVGQRPNLRHSCEPLGGTEGLIETVGFKKTTELKYVMKNKRECQQGVSSILRGQQRW